MLTILAVFALGGGHKRGAYLFVVFQGDETSKWAYMFSA